MRQEMPNPRLPVDEEERSESLTRIVRNKIEAMILRGEVAAGERLNEAVLAEKLNVSRGPVREATRLLAESGLVTVNHNRGVFVRVIRLEDALHIYDVRAGLANVAGRLAALRASKAQVASLRNLWEKMDAAIAAEDPDEYSRVNREFHTEIVAISNNPRLIDFNAITEREMSLFLRRGATTRPRMSNQQHLEILEKIAAGDADGAAKAFEAHIVTGKQRMLDSLT